jgi:hypothetical protein
MITNVITFAIFVRQIWRVLNLNIAVPLQTRGVILQNRKEIRMRATKAIRSKAWRRYDKLLLASDCVTTMPPYLHFMAGFKAGWKERSAQDSGLCNITSGCNLTPPPQAVPCDNHCQGRECDLPGIMGYKCGNLPCTKDFANALKNNSSVGGVHS